MVTGQCWPMVTAQEKLLSAQTLAEMRPEKIGRRLKLVRLALKLTPAEMADQLGIERTYWSRFEGGRRPVNETTAALLHERFGVTMDFLILGKWSNLPLQLAEDMRRIEDKIN